jgi:site-specific recombinase XerD
LAASFRRYLRASNKSPRTVETYGEAVDQLGEWLADHDDAPATTGELKRAHIEAFLIHLFDEGKSAATLNNRYRSLRPPTRDMVGLHRGWVSHRLVPVIGVLI